MKLEELVTTLRDTIGVRRVFAKPYTQDGTTVIAAAKVFGGGGGGGGHDQQGQEGEGGGFGLNARPTGAYIIRDGGVHWIPAIDVNRGISVVGAVTIAILITRVRMARIRAGAHRD
jgi:uncharacterized spore protein YtfJ